MFFVRLRTTSFNSEQDSIPLTRPTKLPNHWDVQVDLFFFGVVRILLLEYVRHLFEVLADKFSQITFVGDANGFLIRGLECLCILSLTISKLTDLLVFFRTSTESCEGNFRWEDLLSVEVCSAVGTL